MMIKISENQANHLMHHVYQDNLVVFGSEDGEDQDVLCIVNPNIQMDGALHNRDHFLFYKDELDKVDYLFATPRCLLNGVVTGSNTLLYELYLDGKLYGTDFDMLHHTSPVALVNYKLAKAFVGVAKRNLKQALLLRDYSGSKDTILKKQKWADNYTNIVVDMLKMFGIYTENTSLKMLQEAIKELPKVSHLVYDIAKSLPPQADIEELDFVEGIYLAAWEESL